MTPTPARILGKAAAQRVTGRQVGRGTAILAAAVAGVTVAVATYKVLRGG